MENDELILSNNAAHFQHEQLKLAAYIRNPEQASPLDAWPQDRAKAYADLFYNNIEDFLARFFPVLKEITPAIKWHGMVRDFIARHQSKTPYFLELAQEFLDYLEQERHDPTDPPFMLELAHYEWVELALDISEEIIPEQGFHPAGDLLRGAIFLSPLACSLVYQFPVHRICADYIPEAAPELPSFLVVYRDAQDRVRFMEINAITARLLELIEQQPTKTGQQLLEQIAGETGMDPVLVIAGGADSLRHLRSVGIILGTSLSLAA